MDKLVRFVRGLEEVGRHYTLGYYTVAGARPAAITVHVTVSPADRWEVEFFDDGSIEIERFVNDGGVQDADVDALLAELIADA